MKIPRPSRRWLRFRVTALLFLMLLVAVGAASWRAHVERRIRDLTEARDAALRQWRVVKHMHDQGDIAREDEAAVRDGYFRRRATVEEAEKAAWWRNGTPRPTPRRDGT